jgi:hypothetical protein
MENIEPHVVELHPLLIGANEGVAGGCASRPQPRNRKRPAVSRPDANAPLRLEVAAALAFPDGSITAKALRREARKGRLAITRVAGKHFTTLAAIEEMSLLCLVAPDHPDSSSNQPSVTGRAKSSGTPHGSSGTEEERFALAAARERLSRLASSSPATSSRRTLRLESAVASRAKFS